MTTSLAYRIHTVLRACTRLFWFASRRITLTQAERDEYHDVLVQLLEDVNDETHRLEEN